MTTYELVMFCFAPGNASAKYVATMARTFLAHSNPPQGVGKTRVGDLEE